MAPESPEMSPKSRTAAIDNLHFAIAGVLTCFSVALVVVGDLATSAPLKLSDWAILLVADCLIAFSSYRSIRMVCRKHSFGWLFVLGNSFYALIMMVIQVAQIKR